MFFWVLSQLFLDFFLASVSFGTAWASYTVFHAGADAGPIRAAGFSSNVRA